MIHPIYAAGRFIRKQITRGRPVALCALGHPLTEREASQEWCPYGPEEHRIHEVEEIEKERI